MLTGGVWPLMGEGVVEITHLRLHSVVADGGSSKQHALLLEAA